jgi:hypothetical protein
MAYLQAFWASALGGSNWLAPRRGCYVPLKENQAPFGYEAGRSGEENNGQVRDLATMLTELSSLCIIHISSLSKAHEVSTVWRPLCFVLFWYFISENNIVGGLDSSFSETSFLVYHGSTWLPQGIYVCISSCTYVYKRLRLWILS